MYRFPILTEKKACALQEGKWRAISNPLYQGNTFLDEEAYPDEEDIQYVRYIMEVYPYLDWPIGPDSPHYQGTRILVYTQFENVKIPRYLIWIDKLASGEV
ncbi:MAG TPA: hypothetical protein DHW02_08235, partial [Ktedonobacter sp.]|nr:hypothetical protein [Ktedonobacter sp.]